MNWLTISYQSESKLWLDLSFGLIWLNIFSLVFVLIKLFRYHFISIRNLNIYLFIRFSINLFDFELSNQMF